MKLTFKDLLEKEFILVPDVDVNDFREATLDYFRNTMSNNLETDKDIKNVMKYLLFNIVDVTKDIDTIMNSYFVCKPEEETFCWHLIIDTNVVILDSYRIDMEKQEMYKYIGLEIQSTDADKCEVNIDLSCFEGEDLEKLNIERAKLFELLRLTYYMQIIIGQDS